MKLKFLLTVSMVIVLSLSTSIASADAVAEFTDGNTSTAVDGYVGMAGGGWANAWTPLEYFVTATFNVENTNPLYTNSGNYLSITAADPYSTGLTGGGRATTVRNYTDGIDLEDDYTISFSIRIDEMDDMDLAKDQFLVFEGAAEATNASSSSFFIIKATGNATDPTIFQQWTVTDGNNDGTTDTLDTNLSLAEGNIYEFVLNVHPDPDGNGIMDGNGTYDVAITNITASESFSATDLGWRAAGTTLGGYLHFTTMVAGATDDVGSMSIDNVAISQAQVPEPSTMVLLASALLGLLIWRKK